MTTLKEIISEYETLDKSSIWLVNEMESAIKEFDEAAEQVKEYDQQSINRFEKARQLVENLLGRCEIELKNCDDFQEKYNIPDA